MTDIRILTVRQPWALHIIQSGKDVENRVRNIAGDYRGPVAIHAALKADERALRDLPRLPPNGIPRFFHYGAIIGVVDLVDVHGPHEGLRATGRGEAGGKSWGTWAPCSQWAEPETYHLVLANPRPLAEPIPYRGALGLRRLPEDVARMVLEAVA